MKILIVGGTGKIGQRIISNINVNKHEVFSISKKNKLENNKVKCFKFDYYKNDYEIKSLIKKYKFDVVVNLICFNYTQIKRDYNLYQNSITKYLFISSTSVYQNSKNKITEKSKIEKTNNPYIKGKIAVENFLINKSKNFPYIILRICQVYGENNIPTLFKQRSQTVLKDMYINKRIFLPQVKSNKWKMIYVNDLAKIIVRIISSKNVKIKNNIFNISPDDSSGWKEIYKSYFLSSSQKIQTIYLDLIKIKRLNKKMYDHLVLDKLKNASFTNKKIFKIIKKPNFTSFDKNIKIILKRQKNKIITSNQDEDVLKIFRNAINFE